MPSISLRPESPSSPRRIARVTIRERRADSKQFIAYAIGSNEIQGLCATLRVPRFFNSPIRRQIAARSNS
jgi:hypothetical protein